MGHVSISIEVNSPGKSWQSSEEGLKEVVANEFIVVALLYKRNNTVHRIQ